MTGKVWAMAAAVVQKNCHRPARVRNGLKNNSNCRVLEAGAFPKILPGNSHLQVNLTRELVRSISYLTQTRTRTYFFQSYPPPEASLKDFFVLRSIDIP